MKYYLFIDESGDHGLVKLDSGFTVFLLCGIIINENDYQILRSDINIIKQHFWHKKEVIFHSRDIRKWQNEFQILIDQNVRADFLSTNKRFNKDGQLYNHSFCHKKRCLYKELWKII